MPNPKSSPEPTKLEGALKELNASVRSLRSEVAKDVDIWRSLFLAFLKGIAASLGALVVAIIIIPITLQFLQNVEWVPLVGDFMMKVAVRMEQMQGR